MKTNLFGSPLLLLLGTILISGCQSSSMKGTPFYTGEYEGPQEGYTERVNLWPALYYRDPALSVLWPIFELTDDHTAVRPVYSVYRKKSAHPVYNALWPIARFDTGNQSNRIFPAYWGKHSSLGDEYFVVAPLYWHVDDPFNGDGLNALFPLWIWNTDHRGKRLDLLYPVYANKTTETEKLWRVWPLYGVHSQNNGEELSRFWAWPLGGSKKSARTQEHYLLPFYYAGNKGLQTDLWTLFGGQSVRSNSTRWAVFPALSWGEKMESSNKRRFVLGLAGSEQAGGETSSHILPIYTKHSGKDSSYFFSLPYSTASTSNGASWQAALPLFYSQTDAAGTSRLITPLYSRQNDAAGNSLWRCYFPLLYLNETYDQHFMTLLGGQWRSGQNSGWLATPILSGGTKTPDCEKTIWAAGLAGKKSTAEKDSHYAIPLYYSCPQENRFISLPYLRWQTEDQTSYKVLPLLLSGTADQGETKKTAVAAGVAYWKKQADRLDQSHILPFYSWERDEHLLTLPYGKTASYSYFITPLVGRYLDKKGGWVFPLWQHESTDTRDETNLLLGLGNRYKTAADSGHALFPLYRSRHSAHSDWQDPSLTRYRDDFHALLLFWNNHRRLAGKEGPSLEEHASSGLFPLWAKRFDRPRNPGETKETASILFRLYDYRRTTPANSDRKPYTRHRVLWRLYHKETLGADTSTDIFPAITIDQKENGFQKVSFLWRMFRYETDPATDTTKLDLLFLPLKR